MNRRTVKELNWMYQCYVLSELEPLGARLLASTARSQQFIKTSFR